MDFVQVSTSHTVLHSITSVDTSPAQIELELLKWILLRLTLHPCST